MVNRLVRLLPWFPVSIGALLLAEALWYATSAGGGFPASTLTANAVVFGSAYLVAGALLLAAVRLWRSHHLTGWAALVAGGTLLAAAVFLGPWTLFLADNPDIQDIYGPFGLALSLADAGILLAAPVLLIVAAILDGRRGKTRTPAHPAG